uniref:Uncharacterized protein n=1 Tax=Nelumbo nucifera TaxID=4432 RepID=A0A822YYF1_NELNU|nr:TPA_asm: hypothetical protein HUJ06_013447 [Nelumbo nucifera]
MGMESNRTVYGHWLRATYLPSEFKFTNNTVSTVSVSSSKEFSVKGEPSESEGRKRIDFLTRTQNDEGAGVKTQRDVPTQNNFLANALSTSKTELRYEVPGDTLNVLLSLVKGDRSRGRREDW